MSKIVDVCTYNGEIELFDLRYNILKDFVDEFIVVEFDKTFSGKDKGWLFEFQPFIHWDKVNYFRVREVEYEKYQDLAESSPNTKGADHWKREFMMKESIKDCLTYLNDDDIVFIGDCDEIWDPMILERYMSQPYKLQLLVYTYYLNQRSNEQFWGTLVCRYKDIKNECLNHLRVISDKNQILNYIDGWHFTSMDGVENLRKKLTDSYTDESYATKEILENLEVNYGKKDFLGRDFKYWIDESDWPQYLKDNREKYKHLMK